MYQMEECIKEGQLECGVIYLNFYMYLLCSITVRVWSNVKILDGIFLIDNIWYIIFLCTDMQKSLGNALITGLEILLILKRLFKRQLFYSQRRKYF